MAKDIELGEPFANMGARLIQEVASKTQDNAGKSPGSGASSALYPGAEPLPSPVLGLKNMEPSPPQMKSSS